MPESGLSDFMTIFRKIAMSELLYNEFEGNKVHGVADQIDFKINTS